MINDKELTDFGLFKVRSNGDFTPAVVWTESGEEISGKVTNICDVSTKYGTKTVCTMAVDGTEFNVWLTTVLASEFDKKDVRVGDGITITYEGMPFGKNYKLFTLSNGGEDE